MNCSIRLKQKMAGYANFAVYLISYFIVFVFSSNYFNRIWTVVLVDFCP
jgi:hypothetical protein